MEPSQEGAVKFRSLVKLVSGKTISSEQSANFLELFGDDLEAEKTKAVRDFIGKHFGSKNSNR